MYVCVHCVAPPAARAMELSLYAAARDSAAPMEEGAHQGMPPPHPARVAPLREWNRGCLLLLLARAAREPGGIDRKPPMAAGIGEWDLVGGPAGRGGPGQINALNPGNNGAVRIFRPGFYTRELDLT